MASRASDCVKVALRVRPLIGVEIAKGDNECVVSYPQKDREPQIQIGGDKCFTFDYLFHETSQQKQVYETSIKPLVHSFLQGYNATVIAYGQTGSGKTYTMGTLGCDDAKLQEEWGVIPSAIHDIFNTLKHNNHNSDNDDYKIQCSFIEVYNEEIKDLLDPHTTKSMQIRENVDGPSKIHIPNMKLEVVGNSMDMAEALDRGGACRATAYTQMNAQSSRSHAIFTIHLHHIKADTGHENNDEKSAEPSVIQSKFHFVDLAGSERAKKTGASGTRLMEGISINGGLLALGNVIAALGDPRLKSKHVPFRDSKITRLLQDSLGGNSCTLMIACVSPARSNMLETKNTLNYANRAKNIKNKAVVNRDPRSRQILELRERVKELERQLKHGGSGGGLNCGNSGDFLMRENAHGNFNNDIFQQQIEQISQLQCDLSEGNNELVRLQEKIKNLRLNLSEMQDKYYNEVGNANASLLVEKRKRVLLIERVKEQYADFEVQVGEFSVDDEKEMKEQCMVMERLKLENGSLKKNIQVLEKTIAKNEFGNQQLMHNLHDQVAKLIRGDDIMNENLISPTKRFDISSPAKRFRTESIPELSVHSESKNVLLDNTDDDDDDDDDDEDEDDEYEEDQFNDDNDSDECDDDDDNDISMIDPKKEQLKQENKKKVKETNNERVKLQEEKKISVGYKKKLLKEQKHHHKQMEFIENEQISRERSQRLKSEKYNREINKTNRDISNLQVMLKQLCQQRQSDVGKQAFYEKQLRSLTEELDEAHRQGRLYEVEKSKLNPNDIKKLQAQDVKISNYQNKVKALHIQIRSYKDKLGQIRKLQALHKEDMLKMNQMTRKLSDLKKKKVNLQRKLKEENKTYARWKQQTEKTIKQLRKIQREKTIQLQRHKTALNKTTNALKQKTLALVNLKKKQREMELKKTKDRINNKRRGMKNRGGNVKQIKNKIAKLLSSLIVKHQLFHKYKLFDREYKSLQHELKEFEIGLKNTNIVLNQLNRTPNNDDEQEINGLNGERLEYEQRIEDTQSTIKYIREQMIAMSYKMKENDSKRWKQLQNAQKVSLSCTENDLEKFLTLSSLPYARMCVNFLINQHLRFRLIIDDYKKQTIHLKSEQNKILTAADNEMRKKMVLIEKLQNRIHEEQQKRRSEQIKEATNTIQQQDNIVNQNENNDNKMMVDNDTDNETDNDIDEDLDIDNEDNEVIPFDQEHSLDLQRKQTELKESKKLLNMFCSPQQTQIQRVDQNINQNWNNNNTNSNNCSSAQTLNESLNSNLSSSFRNSMNNLNQNNNQNQNNKQLNVLDHMGHMNNGQISIQLTPFHTPLVKSKTRSLYSSNPNSTYNSFLGNNNNNNSHRSTSNSPLFGSRNEQTTPLLDNQNHNNQNHNNNDLQVSNKESHNNRANSLNVFSRLTNPKHFTATSRTRAQELEALKQKVRRQKESHAQLQKRGNWQKKKMYQSPPHVGYSNVNVAHENVNNDYDMDNEMENDNSNVFERLHTTSIRNTRLTHLNNSMNGDMDTIVEREDINEIGISNEPSRVFNQNEISKKPQRNMNNSNSKSMMLNPHRILTPDT